MCDVATLNQVEVTFGHLIPLPELIESGSLR